MGGHPAAEPGPIGMEGPALSLGATLGVPCALRPLPPLLLGGCVALVGWAAYTQPLLTIEWRGMVGY